MFCQIINLTKSRDNKYLYKCRVLPIKDLSFYLRLLLLINICGVFEIRLSMLQQWPRLSDYQLSNILISITYYISTHDLIFSFGIPPLG